VYRARMLTDEEIDDLIEAFETWVIGADDELEIIWRPYLNKLMALKNRP
jgi:hypothetical protein